MLDAEYDDSNKVVDIKPLTKVAAFFRDKNSVDAILSLSMLRQRNVMQYLNILPSYQYIISELARLLIASRLGLSGTDPDVIADALGSMAQVIQMLEAVQAQMKKVK